MGRPRTAIKFHKRNYTVDNDTFEMARQMSEAMRLPVSALLRLLVRQAHQSHNITIRKGEEQSSRSV
jgi:hypothetical protein